MKRAAVLLLLVVGCAANAPAPESNMLTFRTAASGQQARREGEQHASMAIFDEQTLRNVWPSTAAGEPPKVDFSREMLVLLFAGRKPTGGYTIEPQSASIGPDGWLTVIAPLRSPPPDAIVTQALTTPWLALVVEKREVKGVHWAPNRTR